MTPNEELLGLLAGMSVLCGVVWRGVTWINGLRRDINALTAEQKRMNEDWGERLQHEKEMLELKLGAHAKTDAQILETVKSNKQGTNVRFDKIEGKLDKLQESVNEALRRDN